MKPIRKHAFHSLSSKIFFRIFVVYFFIASVLTTFQMVDVYLRHKQSFMQKLDTYGSSIEKSLGLAIWDYDQEKLDSIAEGILKIPIVTGIKITDLKYGRVLIEKGIAFNVDDGDVIKSDIADNKEEKSRILSILQNKLIENPRTIYHSEQNKAVAVMLLYSNQAAMLDGVKYSLLIILGSALLKTFALWCLFTLVLGRYLVRPLQELTQTVSSVNLHTIRSSLLEGQKETDELRVLQAAFNEMLLRLQDAGGDLEIANKQLSLEVEAKQQAMDEVGVLNEKLESRILERTEKLQESKNFMRQLIESIPNPVFYKTENGCYEMVNEAFKTEFDIQEVLYGSEVSLMDADFLQESSVAEEDCRDRYVISCQQSASYEVSLKDHHGNSHELHISKAPVVDGATECLGVVGMMMNIQERKALERELRTFATIDELTGCYNRRYFLEQANKEVSRGSRHGYMQAVLYLDIDHFKKVNDQYGHQVGDRVLRQFAQVCQLLFRDGDIMGRLGGEEFVILLPYASLEAAVQVAERLRQKIAKMEVKAREIVRITTSIGVAAIGDGIHLEEGIQHADAALYVAKSSGRDQVRCYQKTLSTITDEK